MIWDATVNTKRRSNHGNVMPHLRFNLEKRLFWNDVYLTQIRAYACEYKVYHETDRNSLLSAPISVKRIL